ncbi:MAG: hypothetical protein QM820_01295 [Minicystis sp.]
MYCAIGVDPTKLTAPTSGCARSRSTATLSPWTTLKTPSGRPAFCSSSAQKLVTEGSRSEGFSTNALPQASATGYIHIGTIAGKLKGVMPATTPIGWRSEYESTSVETFSLISPLSRCESPQANSITSRPRCTSPWASEKTLPCSSVSIRAMSSLCRFTSSRKAKSTRVRVASEAWFHAKAAFLAVATAASTSSTEA